MNSTDTSTAPVPVEPGITPGKRPSRVMLYLPVSLLLLVCVGWSIFWVVASHFTETTLESWTAREAAAGRVWSCPDRQIGGFPFDIVVTCAKPTFTGRLAGRESEGSVTSIRALAQAYQPSIVLIEMDGPLTVRTGEGGPTLAANWTHLRASLHGAPEGLARGSVVLDNPKVTFIDAGQTYTGQASHLEAHLRRSPDAPAADRAYDWAFEVDDALVPALDPLLRSDASITARGTGLLTQVEIDGAGSPIDRLERWRTAGGRLDITDLSVTKGNASADVKGTASLDPLHRPEGRLQARIAGLGPVLAQFGVPASVVAIDNLIGGLLGGGKAKDKGAHKDEVTLPVIAENGRLRIGPVVLQGAVQPLY